MKRRLDNITVVVDSNEFYHGKTWVFPSDCVILVRPLIKYGCDYAVHGQLGLIGVERKAYNDYVNCLGKGWKRFLNQLDKLQRNKYHAVIVEANIDDPIHPKSRMIHDAVITQTAKVTAMGIPVVFAASRRKASYMCMQFFKEAVRRIQDGV